MVAGDVTIIGPYGTTATGVALADTALTSLSSGVASDKVNIISCVNGLGFYVVWVEGV